MIESKYWHYWLGGVCLLYFLAIGVDTMDVDASQYITMSREMKVTGGYLQVYEQGRDYLDKPPFLFWISALSMHVFGENNFAFKFPSILFAIVAIISTYKLARIYYEEHIAKMAAYILASSQALFLITNDIRTDTILMGWVSMALWLLTKWYKEGGLKYFLLGCAAVGGGMLTKGPIAIMVPVFALGSQVLLHRKFNYIFRKEYLLGLLIISIILLPMCIGLYQQFDLHPEKTMYGRQGTSGLRFFFWTQSFGRITGESVWDNGAPFGFLFENLLWGFLPWTLFMIGGLITGWLMLAKAKFKLTEDKEGLSIAGFTITYFALASSNYQLPHYIYVVLPLLAIVTANFLNNFYSTQYKQFLKSALQIFQIIVLILLCSLPFMILNFVFPTPQYYPWLIALLPIIVFLIYILKNKNDYLRLFNISILIISSLNIFISLWFYPSLLSYQAGNVVGRITEKLNIDKDAFFMYQYNGSTWNMHFYSKNTIKRIDDPFSYKKEIYVITGQEGMTDIKRKSKVFEVIYSGQDFGISALTPEFLYYKTRKRVSYPYYLVRLGGRS